MTDAEKLAAVEKQNAGLLVLISECIGLLYVAAYRRDLMSEEEWKASARAFIDKHTHGVTVVDLRDVPQTHAVPVAEA